jgi:hypothetical protein
MAMAHPVAPPGSAPSLLHARIGLHLVPQEALPSHVLPVQEVKGHAGHNHQQQRNQPARPLRDIRKRLARLEKDAGQPREFAHPRRFRFHRRCVFRCHISTIVLQSAAARSAIVEQIARRWRICESRPTMRAKLLLPILAAALLGLAACDIEDFGGFDRYRQDFHYTYPLKSGGRLSVETFNGSVEVSGWDQETVDISGSKYAATQEAADALKVAIDNSPDSVSIRVTRPSDRRGNMGARFVIKIPRAAYVDRIFTSNGAIRTQDGSGPARLRTSNAEIRVQACAAAWTPRPATAPSS